MGNKYIYCTEFTPRIAYGLLETKFMDGTSIKLYYVMHQ
jgi:hypothetical protein